MSDFLAAAERARQAGDLQNAYRMLVAAVADVQGQDAEIWYRLGCAAHDNKRYESAVSAFMRADRLRPSDHKTLTNLGMNLGMIGRFAEAKEALEKAAEVDADAPLGHLHLSQILYALDERDRALEESRRAVELAPDMPMAHMVLGFCLLGDGHWSEGFAEYEWRFRHKLPEFLAYPFPLWRGEETGTLLIVAEQGLGDAIMMMRYVPEAARRAEQVKWLVHGELYQLALDFAEHQMPFHPIEIMPMPVPVPAADAFIPMMSLPRALKIERPEFAGPYIAAPAANGQNGHWDLRAGISWAGDPKHDNARLRDIPLENFLPLTEIPGVRLFSLQVGEPQRDLDRLMAHALITDLSGHIADMASTARLISSLDLIICCDTALAHLAGAMGREVWLLANGMATDWRWKKTKGDDRNRWYPSLKIWDLEIGERWSDLMRGVAAGLRALHKLSSGA